MSAPALQPELFPDRDPQPGIVHVNAQCVMRSSGDRRVVVVRGVQVAAFDAADRMAAANAMVMLVECGYAHQLDVARAFGCSARTVRRCEGRYARGGLPALSRQPGRPSGQPRRPPDRDEIILAARKGGLSNRAIARGLGVDEKAVRKALRRMSWSDRGPDQCLLDLAASPALADPHLSDRDDRAAAPTATDGGASPPQGADPNVSAFAARPAAATAADVPAVPARGADPNLSASSDRPLAVTVDAEPLGPCLDTDPAHRRFDRLLAHMGRLHDARPLFASAARVQGAGVLLAVPALVASGALGCAREVYGGIGPAFYGLRTTVMTLLLMALLRIRRPEGLKETCPVELGRVLGLDRAPEVKTLRRKLAQLAAFGKAADFGRALAVKRVAARGEALGFLYVDGHVRVYHGKHKLPKAHVTRMRISMPATTDYWVNDRDGEPLLVLTAQANAGLVTILPSLLAEVRQVLGPRRATVVFDRGGWSPALFAQLKSSDFDVLTYRKGSTDPVPADQFVDLQATIDDRDVQYRLAENQVVLKLKHGTLQMRQVTRLGDDGHQTHVLTTRTDLSTIEVAWRMFERWRQENFFKYLRDEFALDALCQYAVEPDDPNRTVPNPARRPLDTELRKLKKEFSTDQWELALRACADPANLTDSVVQTLGQGLLDKAWRRHQLQAQRDALPARVPVSQTTAAPIVKLAGERKLLTNLFKMVAYQAESDLVRLLAPFYNRIDDEGRTLVQNALTATASLDVTNTELRIRLAPFSSRHRSLAIGALCAELDRAQTVFPGTQLRLRYAVDEHPRS